MGISVYKIVNDVPVLDGYIKSKDELDRDLVADLRVNYSQDEEFALINKGIANENDPEYVDYRSKVDALKTVRDNKLSEAEALLANTEEIEITENEEPRKIRVWK